MSEALTRIIEYACAFSQGIERCRSNTVFSSADVEDAYNRLNRLRDRYLHERDNGTLIPTERTAIRTVFEEDKFIEGMLNARQVAEHVIKRNDLFVTLTSNQTIPLYAEVSAGSMFGGPVFRASDIEGNVYDINHLRQLEEAEKRIQAALARAKGD